MEKTMISRRLGLLLVCCWLTASVQSAIPGPRETVCPMEEPSVEKAKGWWTEQTNVWTPVGWKNNYLRYAVLYNGALIIDPAAGLMGPRPNSKPFVGQDFMLTFSTHNSGSPTPLPDRKTNVRSIDRGYGRQGWNNNHSTPVLWTEYQVQDGLIIREEVFAHQAGSGDAITGIEPLYAWVRLTVTDVYPGRHPETYPVAVQMSGCYYLHDDACYNMVSDEPSFALMVDPHSAAYHNELSAESFVENGLTGMRILESDGRVRMVVVPGEEGRFRFSEVQKGVYALTATLRAKVNDCVEFIVPMLPGTRDEVDAELALCYDGALTQSDWYWSQTPSTAAKFQVPEHYISEAIDRSLKFAPVIAELDYVTGEYSYLTGAWGYDCLWATPTSMVSHMLADQMGYHDLTQRYSEIFYKNQGKITGPGPCYDLHPGYYGSPKTLTSIDWLSDHGAILLQVSTSALLSGDKVFIDHWLPSIVKACDFIREMSARKGHDGVVGLLPPAVSTDEGLVTQSVQNMAWNYKGLVTAVRLMKKAGHPRAAEFAAFADNFKTTFQKAYRELAENGERWIDDQGRSRYKPPTTLFTTPQPYHPFSDAFYLDGGPMILVWAGLMDAGDPIMADVVDFFRNGPNKRYYKPVYNCIWKPSLQHEISTCEPCYSWNVFSSWKLGDRQHFLEGMYSLFVGALSQNTYISCEHRHGIQGNLFVAPLAAYLARLAVIDDQIVPGELHLLRICPQAWIRSDEETFFGNMPTEYGPVNLKFRKSNDGTQLDITFSAAWRDKPDRVVLHIPPVPGLDSVKVNGVLYGTQSPIAL